MNIGDKPLIPQQRPMAVPPVHRHEHEPHHHHHHHEEHHHHYEGHGNEWEHHAHGLAQQPVPLPPGSPTDGEYVTSLYKELLGRAPDPEGYHAHMSALEKGLSREQLRDFFLNSSEYKGLQQVPKPAANLPPITIDTVKDAARAYLAQHPEIADRPSYEDTAAVAQLREGVIAMLAAKGYKVGRILGPDGKPYDQMIAFGNPGDPQAQAYRVTAGGARISEAINVGYTNDPIPWSDVH